MKYFVTIENNPYFHWQIELLIENFKLLGIEKDLVIGVAFEEKADFGPNLANHINKFTYFNFGKKHQFPKINKIYGLLEAIQNNLITDSFVLLHPDMLLKSPIKPFNGDINCQILEDFDPLVAGYMEKYQINQIISDGAMAFNAYDKQLFSNICINMHDLFDKYGSNYNLEALAWTHGLIGKNIVFNELECDLIHESDAPIIHYKHGIPPLFSKNNYHFIDSKANLSGVSHPYTIFETVNPTMTSNYMKKIIDSYQSKYWK